MFILLSFVINIHQKNERDNTKMNIFLNFVKNYERKLLKMNFYERLVLLCNEKKISPSTLSVILGFSRGSLTAWKNGTVPSSKTVQTIRDYFGVTTDYLMTGATMTPAVVYTADPDVEIFEAVALLKNEKIRQLALQYGDIDADKRVIHENDEKRRFTTL